MLRLFISPVITVCLTVILAFNVSAAMAADPMPRTARDQSEDIRSTEQFDNLILPLLKAHCFECHSHAAGTAEGGLMLDSRQGWQTGGDSGPAIQPGRPRDSLLLKAIQYSESELQMPPDGRLSDQQIAVVEQWIADGAFDPREAISPAEDRGDPTNTTGADHWSLQPLGAVQVPEVDHHQGARTSIDALLFHSTTNRQSVPAASNRYTLLRRATFDLLGLPPTLQQIDEFVNDTRPDAWERLIDRLLASPHYGERWGRHWLDLARYGDSNGGDINYAHANAWRYRDYVVRSFNNDTPYDDFIREQIAGDLLPDGGDEERRRELLTATGFLMLGPKMLAEVDTEKLLVDIVDEQLDVVGKTFLGMTFGCARCHDHKFDPITTRDYYSLAGIFRSTQVIDVLRPQNGVSEWLERDVTPNAVRLQIEAAMAQERALEKRIAELGGTSAAQAPIANAAPLGIRSPQLPEVRSATWAAWARISGPQNLGAVISASYEGANQGHSLGFDNNMTPRVVWNHGTSRHTIIAAADAVDPGKWQHLALTFDEETQQLALYVNGRLSAAASDVTSTPFDVVGVGRRESSQQWQLKGDVDEVLVYDVALPPEAVAMLAERKRPGHRPLVDWSFDRTDGDRSITAGEGQYPGYVSGTTVAASIVRDAVIGNGWTFLTQPMQSSDSDSDEVSRLAVQLKNIRADRPSPVSVMAADSLTPTELPVYIRGNHRNPAPHPQPRTTPAVFNNRLPAVKVAADQNGRLQLAEWIASDKNPLTARVMVNRIWQHHFGIGLVESPSNFGTRGLPPSHPKLLDMLARRFIDNDWSVKSMHRLIMRSAAYRAESFNTTGGNEPGSTSAADEFPGDRVRLPGRAAVRRLEAEAIRDTLFAVTGELDLTIGGTLLDSPNKQRVKLTPDATVYDSNRRSIYLPVIRVRGYDMFSVFDVSDNGQHVEQRPTTLVAQQALFLMNNPLVIARAERLAGIVLSRDESVADHTAFLYLTLYGRPPTVVEQNQIANGLAVLINQTPTDASKPEQGEHFAWQQVIHTMLCANEFIHIP